MQGFDFVDALFLVHEKVECKGWVSINKIN